tara:strand:+ start:1574 stop:2722 length:1149 start_codon:yes stop_codon:yes gene_type:complete
MKKNIIDNDVNFYKFAMLIFHNKFKILLISFSIAFLVTGFNYFNISGKKVKTPIKPIDSFETAKYSNFNAILEIQKDVIFTSISSKLLNNLFREVISDHSTFEEELRKFEILKREDYDDDIKFNNAIKNFTSGIEIIPPIEARSYERYTGDGISKVYWSIEVKTINTDKWNDALLFVNKQINKKVYLFLIKSFANAVDTARTIRNLKIRDIDISIKNIKEDYKRLMSDRLAFLNEQAAIARELGLAKNSIEVQNFNSEQIIVSNLKVNPSYYMRGYKIIEKEIKLIKNRKDEKAFIDGLLDLEKKKRSLEDFSNIDYLQSIFIDTMGINSKQFSAALIDTKHSRYDDNKLALSKILLLSIFIGGIIGIFYVLISEKIFKKHL